MYFSLSALSFLTSRAVPLSQQDYKGISWMFQKSTGLLPSLRKNSKILYFPYDSNKLDQRTNKVKFTIWYSLQNFTNWPLININIFKNVREYASKPNHPERRIVFSKWKWISIVLTKDLSNELIVSLSTKALLQAWPEGATENLMGIAQDWKILLRKWPCLVTALFLVEFGINGLQVPLTWCSSKSISCATSDWKWTC